MLADNRTSFTPASHRWSQKLPTSAAVRAGELLFISGQVACDANLKPTHLGDVKAQARSAFSKIKALVKEAGGSMADIVDIISFHSDVRTMDTVFDVGRQIFKKDFPAWTALGMHGSYHPEILISIRAIAHLGTGKKICATPKSMAWMKKLPLRVCLKLLDCTRKTCCTRSPRERRSTRWTVSLAGVGGFSWVPDMIHRLQGGLLPSLLLAFGCKISGARYLSGGTTLSGWAAFVVQGGHLRAADKCRQSSCLERHGPTPVQFLD